MSSDYLNTNKKPDDESEDFHLIIILNKSINIDLIITVLILNRV